MKALSIRQPWAWLICAGYKDIENRNRRTRFRGRIYVHAGNRFDFEGYNWLCSNSIGRLDRVDLDDWARLALYPLTGIIGEVDIVDCIHNTDIGMPARRSPWFTGTYGFVLANPLLYDKPIPCKGKLGFFEPDIKCSR